MPNKHKTPLVGWHPPADLAARFKALLERRGGDRRGVKSEALNEALRNYLDRNENSEGRRGTYVQGEANLPPGFTPPSAALAVPAEPDRGEAFEVAGSAPHTKENHDD